MLLIENLKFPFSKYITFKLFRKENARSMQDLSGLTFHPETRKIVCGCEQNL